MNSGRINREEKSCEYLQIVRNLNMLPKLHKNVLHGRDDMYVYQGGTLNIYGGMIGSTTISSQEDIENANTLGYHGTITYIEQ